MKLGQLIEYSMRNIFFFWKNHTQNVVEKPLLGTLLKDQT